MKEKRSLLMDLMAEDVSIFTTQKTAVQTDSGEVAEIPHIVEGVFVDFDDEYVLLDNPEGVIVVNRNHIVDIRLVSHMAEVMLDPKKPAKESMS